jgi:hypothetical protein
VQQSPRLRGGCGPHDVAFTCARLVMVAFVTWGCHAEAAPKRHVRTHTSQTRHVTAATNGYRSQVAMDVAALLQGIYSGRAEIAGELRR